MTTIRSLTGRVHPGLPVGNDQLAMVPLTRVEPSRLRYDTLQAALAAGSIRITEVGLGGSVPEVRVVNDGKLPVLMLEGAALVGAKQNRVLNLTVLVPAGRETRVPVSCVEQGRWRHVSAEFAEGASFHFAAARAAKTRDVSASLAFRGSRHSDQGRVWDDMARYASEFQSVAPSGAMQDVYKSVEDAVGQLVARLRLTELQVGAAFVSRGRLLGIDAFDAPATLAAEFPKIARSYAVEAVRMHGPDREIGAALEGARLIVGDLLAQLGAGEWRSYPGVGLGTDLRLTTSRLLAGALVHEDEVAHLAAFPGLADELEVNLSHAPAMPRRRFGT